MKKVSSGLLLLMTLVSCGRRIDLLIEPAEWNFGSIPSYFVAKKEIVVRNRGARPVSLRFVSTCDCLHVAEAPAELLPGQKASLLLSYDPQGQSGFVEAALIIVAKRGRSESRVAMRTYGKVLPAGNQPAR